MARWGGNARGSGSSDRNRWGGCAGAVARGSQDRADRAVHLRQEGAQITDGVTGADTDLDTDLDTEGRTRRQVGVVDDADSSSAGYTKEERMVTAQFSGEQLIKNDDPQRNTIGNGGGPAGVLVRRWTSGAFNAATVAAPVHVRVGTHAGLFGATPAGLFDDQVPERPRQPTSTLALKVAADQWVNPGRRNVPNPTEG